MTETILITGANRGTGLALTKISLMKNMNVEACCRNLRNSKELNELSQRHSNLNIHEMDVTSAQSIINTSQNVKFDIDMLINSPIRFSFPMMRCFLIFSWSNG